METSAKASINVEEAFFTLARDIKAKMEKRLVSRQPGLFWQRKRYKRSGSIIMQFDRGFLRQHNCRYNTNVILYHYVDHKNINCHRFCI